MSGYHCKHCGKLNMPYDNGSCCDAAREEHRDLVASVIMRDPVQREGCTEIRSNEKDEEELWGLLDG